MVVAYGDDANATFRLERGALTSGATIEPIAGATEISNVWATEAGSGLLALREHTLLTIPFRLGAPATPLVNLPGSLEASVLPSPDGRLVAIAEPVCASPEAAGEAVGIYDLNGALRRVRSLPSVAVDSELVELSVVAFSPDNTMLAFEAARYESECRGVYLSGVELHLLDLRSGRHQLLDAAGLMGDAAFSPDGRLLAYAVDDNAVEIRVADLSTGRHSTIARRPAAVYDSRVVWPADRLLFSLGGKVWAHDPGTARTTQLGTVEPIKYLGRLPTVAGASPEGAAVALASAYLPTEVILTQPGRRDHSTVPLPSSASGSGIALGVWVGFR